MSSGNDRVVITGMGAVSAAGGDVDALWQSAVARRTNVGERHLERIARRLPVYAVGELPAVRPNEKRLTLHADRSALLALGAAREAWTAAGLETHGIDPLRIGLFVGSSRGPVENNVPTDAAALKHPLRSVYSTFSSIAGVIAAVLKIEGCSLMSSATCVSGAVALKMALQMIQTGELEVAVAGGVDAPLVDVMLEQFAATRVLSGEVSARALRPFAQDRSGTVLGEGAGFVVLESARSAAQRGASILAELNHVGMQCDSAFRAGGDKEGEALRKLTQRMLAHVGWAPGEVDLLHLHGTGTQVNDAMESACVRQLFGPEAQQPLCWASKGITGHTLGASPLLQLILTLQAMRHAFVPGTANCEPQDAGCPVRLSLGAGEALAIRRVLSLNSGFWGNTSCISLTAWQGQG